MAAKYADENVFMVYGFEKNGIDDPAEVAKRGIENNSIMKCPVIAADAAMAVSLFSEKYPDLLVAGIVNLSDMKKEMQILNDFLTANSK